MNKQASPLNTKKNTIPVGEKVYKHLKSAVLSGRFGPGKRLKEEHLAKQLGVSRTPVREALHRLVSEGLISPLQTRGFTVSHDSKEEMEEFFEMRIFLEGYALRTVCQTISEEFHERLEEIIKNAEIALKRGQEAAVLKWNKQFHDTLRDLMQEKSRVRWLMKTMRMYVLRYGRKTPKYPDGGRRAIDGHKKILLALRLKDPDLCEKVMREHIWQAKEDVLQATLKTTLELVVRAE